MDHIETLLKWGKDNGALVTPLLQFKYIQPGVIGGIYHSQPEDPELKGCHIKIPTDLTITLHDAIESLNFGAYADFQDISNQTSNINSVLKLYLARERLDPYLSKSFYKPYLQLLPNTFNSPYFWSPEDKAYIKGTNLGGSLKGNIAHLVEEWWQLINLLPQDLPKPDQHFVNMKFYYEYKFYEDKDMYEYFVQNPDINNWTSFPNYLWASMVLKSRSFPAYLVKNVAQHIGDRLDEAMLVPILDLLNHDMKADTEWGAEDIDNKGFFSFKSNSVVENQELFNNYGRKGNEELLLAYGFCIEGNEADTCALKVKVPVDMLPELEKEGMKLPSIEDYTNSIVRSGPASVPASAGADNPIKGDSSAAGADKFGNPVKGDASASANASAYAQYSDGLLFYILTEQVPSNLIFLFQNLVKNPSEPHVTLRLKFAGINQLRAAIEQKLSLINTTPAPATSPNSSTINIYVNSQKNILTSAIKNLKRLEKQMLTDPDIKGHLISLKNVYKKDKKFADALLVSLGITSYDQLVANSFQDQAWLLYLIRCHNRKEYQDEETNYLPEWIYERFEQMAKVHKILPEEVLQYKSLYEGLVLPMTEAAPDVFNRGVWTVEELILSARVLDTISFTRGKEQECILVRSEGSG